MKKIILTFFSLVFLITLFVAIFLSTMGYETDRFNNFISNKVKNTDKNLDVSLKKIKVKLDLKKLNLFLSTSSPKIKYHNINLPVSQLNIYFDFFSILKKEIYISRASIAIDELSISNVKKLIVRVKPSNFKSFILNNVSDGFIEGFIDLDFLENLELSDYKLNGNLKKTDINFFKKIEINNTNFNFIADSGLILINGISFNFRGIPVINGSIAINQKDGFLIEGSSLLIFI